MSDATGVPFTCPTIDDAISHMEDVRSANIELRERATTALSEVDDLDSRLADSESRREEAEAEVAELRAELDSALEQLHAFEQETAPC